MDTGAATFSRVVSEVLSGTAHWVARSSADRDIHPAPLVLTPDARRRHDAERKRRQRAGLAARRQS
ncbi:hypothetical protein [Paraburkholderia sp. HD33-4]|uniref:hypothetical protein n=1 Tax=Paraburkholderia sp. HD33-4 TaxID=2883242 RepID=UPI001F276C7E|nr:hypothetical protein [Paraburkholderia sp. HD33-4]